MIGSGRISGLILAVVGLGIFLIGALFLLVSGTARTIGGMIFGFGFFFIISAPLVGGGIYLMVRGQQEKAEFAEVEKQKKILNMVLAQGQVRLSEVAVALNMTRSQVEDHVRDLVGKELFSGAINWKDGILYSREAATLKSDRRCPNCGGELQLAGKGVIKCPWCGSEVFLNRA